MKRTTQAERAKINLMNSIIHRDNLYVCTPAGKRRVFNCHKLNGAVVVMDLHDEKTVYDVTASKFENGYGQGVAL